MPKVVYEYRPETGKLPGMTFEEQTEDFLNNLSDRVENVGDASEIANEALDKANDAIDRVTNIEGTVNNHTQTLANHEQRIVALETNDVVQDGRLDALEAAGTETDTRLDLLEESDQAQNVAIDGKLDKDLGNIAEGAVLDIVNGGTGANNAVEAVQNLGIDGQLVPTGGAQGQVLTKVTATTGDFEWADPTGGGGGNLPAGGTAGQLLVKNSATPNDASWKDPAVAALPAGGTTGQVLTKVADTAGAVAWADSTGGGGGGSSTLAQAVLYMNATALILAETEPVSTGSTTFALTSNNTPVTRNFVFTNPVELTISATASYGAWCYLTGLNDQQQYRLEGAWRLPAQANFLVSDGAVSFTAAGSTELVFIPMNANYLTADRVVPANQGLQLGISLRRLSGGTNTVTLQSGPGSLSAFVRNGGDISANNVYSVFKGETRNQSTVNTLLDAAVTLAQDTANTAQQTAEEALATALSGATVVIGQVGTSPKTFVLPNTPSLFAVAALKAFPLYKIKAAVWKQGSPDVLVDNIDAFLQQDGSNWYFTYDTHPTLVQGDTIVFRNIVLIDVLDNQSKPVQSAEMPVGTPLLWPVGEYLSWVTNHDPRYQGCVNSSSVRAGVWGEQAVPLTMVADTGAGGFSAGNTAGEMKAVYNGIMVTLGQNNKKPLNGTVVQTERNFVNSIYRTNNGVQFQDVTVAAKAALRADPVDKFRYYNTNIDFAAAPDGIYGITNFGDVIFTEDGYSFVPVGSGIPFATLARLGSATTTPDSLPCGSAGGLFSTQCFVIKRPTSTDGYRLFAIFQSANNATVTATTDRNMTFYTYSDDRGATWAPLAVWVVRNTTNYSQALQFNVLRTTDTPLVLGLWATTGNTRYNVVSWDYGTTWTNAGTAPAPITPTAINSRNWMTTASSNTEDQYVVLPTALVHAGKAVSYTAASGAEPRVDRQFGLTFITWDSLAQTMVETTKTVTISLSYNCTSFKTVQVVHNPDTGKLMMAAICNGTSNMVAGAESPMFEVTADTTPETAVILAYERPNHAANLAYFLTEADLNLVPQP